MADYVVDNNTFEFTYSAKQQEEVERIRSKYLPREKSKMEQLRKLDKQAEKPGQIAAISAGSIGMLLLGIGMSCTLVGNPQMSTFIIGIIVGILGIVVVGLAYPLYLKVTKKQREKIADQVIALTNEISMEI